MLLGSRTVYVSTYRFRRCNNDGRGFGEVRLPLLQCVTLVGFVVDLSDLGCGGRERSRRCGEDEGEGKEEMWSSDVVVYRR